MVKKEQEPAEVYFFQLTFTLNNTILRLLLKLFQILDSHKEHIEIDVYKISGKIINVNKTYTHLKTDLFFFLGHPKI